MGRSKRKNTQQVEELFEWPFKIDLDCITHYLKEYINTYMHSNY